MASKHPTEKIKQLHQMLLDMAIGPPQVSLATGSPNDALDELIILVHQLASKIRNTFLEHGYVHPSYRYQPTVHLLFVLNSDGTLKGCSLNAPKVLGYTMEALHALQSFTNVLTIPSQELLQSVQNDLRQRPYVAHLELQFVTQSRQLLPTHCAAVRLAPHNEIIITSLGILLEELLYGLPLPKKASRAKPGEAETAQQLHDYILHHLDQPLPTLKALSKMFKTNDFDLKQQFKHFFHQSIYQFYNDQRLSRAHTMVLETDIALKEIAFLNGFNGYLNFYKAFKKKYHYAPSALYRKMLDPNSLPDSVSE